MLADISQAIAETQTNIHNLKARVNDEKSMGVFDIIVQIHSLDHFKKVTKSLKKIKGFLDLERVK